MDKNIVHEVSDELLAQEIAKLDPQVQEFLRVFAVVAVDPNERLKAIAASELISIVFGDV